MAAAASWRCGVTSLVRLPGPLLPRGVHPEKAPESSLTVRLPVVAVEVVPWQAAPFAAPRRNTRVRASSPPTWTESNRSEHRRPGSKVQWWLSTLKTWA